METGSRRPAVTGGLTLTAAAVQPPHASMQEWQIHTRCIQDQPKEVMDAAADAFGRAYDQQPVTGTKARALALVSLLWATRRLHGSNRCNEHHLLTRLHTPTRLMNKAFSTLAAVITPPQPPEHNYEGCWPGKADQRG